MSPPYSDFDPNKHYPGLKDLRPKMKIDDKPWTMVLETKDRKPTRNTDELYVLHGIYRTHTSPQYIFWITSTWLPSAPNGNGTLGFLKWSAPPTPSVDFFGVDPKTAYKRAVEIVGDFVFTGVEHINLGPTSSIWDTGRTWIFYDESGNEKGKTVLVENSNDGKWLEKSAVKELFMEDWEQWNEVSSRNLSPSETDTTEFLTKYGFVKLQEPMWK